MKTKLFITSLLAVFSCCSLQARATHNQITFPNTDGYIVLKCDFHVHTLFSDGIVWPSVRVDEASMEGLDAIAITDHLRRPKQKDYIVGDGNASYKIAASASKSVLVIPGTEISGKGHWNALFLKDAEALMGMKYEDAIKAAVAQGAFITWNHPAWVYHSPNGPEWWPSSDKIYKEGNMNGIEVYNHGSDGYSPEVFQWALDKNLTIFCDTDIHSPADQQFDYAAGEHRPVTLVFAKEKSLEAIREALDNRLTAAYAGDMIYGRKEILEPLAKSCIRVGTPRQGRPGSIRVHLENLCSCPIVLTKAPGCENLSFNRLIKLRPNEKIDLQVFPADRKNGSLPEGIIPLNFFVENFLIAPDQPLEIHLEIKNPTGR